MSNKNGEAEDSSPERWTFPQKIAVGLAPGAVAVINWASGFFGDSLSSQWAASLVIVSVVAVAASTMGFLLDYLRSNDSRTGSVRVVGEAQAHASESAAASNLPAPSPEELTRQRVISYYGATQGRLQGEVSSLLRRNQLNLGIGVVTTFVAVGILVWLAIDSTSQGAHALQAMWKDGLTPTQLGLLYLPRIALATSIELFAFFFLRLYKLGLGEIKFYQNELTNAEARFAGMDAALGGKDPKSLALTISTFIATERNFIIRAGESTVDLEHRKLDGEELRRARAAIDGAVRSEPKE